MRTEQEMLETILNIATEDERIRAAYLFGSRANSDVKKDKYQDYDITFVVTETESFQKDKNWLNVFGQISMLFESELNRLTFFGIKDTSAFSRRYVFCMLLKDGNRIDLVIETKEEAMRNYSAIKPTIVLVDKDGIFHEMFHPNNEDNQIDKPDENLYHACCGGFWWFLNYVAKGIARDELPFAMDFFNSYVRLTLNRMTNWYIGTQTDFSVSTGRHSKYYKKHLPKDFYDLYAGTYSDSNYANFWNAVFSACELFNKLAIIVGTHFCFNYNHQEEDSMMDYLQKVKNDF